MVPVVLAPFGTAYAEEWMRFDNPQFGYQVDVPPNLVQQAGSDAASITFKSPVATLRVTASQRLGIDYSLEAARILEGLNDWNVVGSIVTPSGLDATLSNGGRRGVLHAIVYCEGRQSASLLFEYSVADMAALEPLISRLQRSLQPLPHCPAT